MQRMRPVFYQRELLTRNNNREQLCLKLSFTVGDLLSQLYLEGSRIPAHTQTPSDSAVTVIDRLTDKAMDNYFNIQLVHPSSRYVASLPQDYLSLDNVDNLLKKPKIAS